MFRAKDAAGIRAIQNALRCCGLRSTGDMAWPFPGAGRSGRECEARFEEGEVVPRCLDGWRGEERAVGGMLVGVVVGVFVWKVSALLFCCFVVFLVTVFAVSAAKGMFDCVESLFTLSALWVSRTLTPYYYRSCCSSFLHLAVAAGCRRVSSCLEITSAHAGLNTSITRRRARTTVWRTRCAG